MTNVEKIGLGGLITGVAASGYAVYLHLKLNKIASVLERVSDSVSDNIAVDIPEEIVNRAMTKAIDREVNKAVRTASTKALTAVREDIQKEVQTAVEDSYSDIRATVSIEISKQVADIDIKRLKDDATERAKALIIEKFDGKLDSLLDDFNQNLANVTKIYNSIAESMTKKKDSETTFRIGN
jgi:hypothetical protein